MKLKDKIEDIYAIRHKLQAIARRMLGTETEAEDALQDLYLKALEKGSELDKYPSGSAFAVNSLKNLCIDKLRKKKEIRLDSSLEYFGQTTDNTEQKIDVRVMIETALSRLPEKQQLIFSLRDLQGYEYEEIENITGMKINAIKTNLSRARKTVRELLEIGFEYER